MTRQRVARLANGLAVKLVLTASLVAALPALTFAGETVSVAAPDPAACSKSILAMGASMGHTPALTSDGRPAFNFILRANGIDYDALCDAQTGVIKDVNRRGLN